MAYLYPHARSPIQQPSPPTFTSNGVFDHILGRDRNQPALHATTLTPLKRSLLVEPLWPRSHHVLPLPTPPRPNNNFTLPIRPSHLSAARGSALRTPRRESESFVRPSTTSLPIQSTHQSSNHGLSSPKSSRDVDNFTGSSLMPPIRPSHLLDRHNYSLLAPPQAAQSPPSLDEQNLISIAREALTLTAKTSRTPLAQPRYRIEKRRSSACPHLPHQIVDQHPPNRPSRSTAQFHAGLMTPSPSPDFLRGTGVEGRDEGEMVRMMLERERLEGKAGKMVGRELRLLWGELEACEGRVTGSVVGEVDEGRLEWLGGKVQAMA